MRKKLSLEETWGYRMNQKKDYHRIPNRPVMFIIAHRFMQKQICRALENDFDFTTNGTIDRGAWELRGIRFIRAYRSGLKEWFKRSSRQCFGSVFVVCGARVHRPAIFVNRDKHLVLLVPSIASTTWPKQSIFKQAAEYLNIDINRFRPY